MTVSIRNHVAFPLVTSTPSPSGYLPGGWGFRLPLTFSPGAFTDFTCLVDITHPGLKSQGNGGHVFSGLDLAFATTQVSWQSRFATAERVQRLAHDLRFYDPVAGRIVAWVYLPSVPLAGLDFDLYFDHTNPITVPIAGAWTGWQLALAGDSANGVFVDSSGFQRHAVPVGKSLTLYAGPFPGHHAFPATGHLTVTALPVRRQFALSFWFQHTTVASAQTVYHHENAGDRVLIEFLPAHVVQVSLSDADGPVVQTFQCTDARIDNGAWHLFHLTWTGAGATVYLDGAPLTSVGTSAGANTRCEPGTLVAIDGRSDGSATYQGLLTLVREGWRVLSAQHIAAEYANQTGGGISVGSMVVVPTVTVAQTVETPIPYQLGDSLASGVSIDHNAYLLRDSDPVARLEGVFASCVVNGLANKGCWQQTFPAFDVHSGWSTSVNLDKYQDADTYAQPLSIADLTARFWHCTGATTEYPTCVGGEHFIQYLASSIGTLGFFNPVHYADADALFTTDDYRAVAGTDGFLATVPTDGP